MDALLNLSFNNAYSPAEAVDFSARSARVNAVTAVDPIQATAAVEGGQVQNDTSSERSNVDTYTQSEKQGSAGLYRVAKDADGNDTVVFDTPDDDTAKVEDSNLPTNEEEDAKKTQSADEDDQKTTTNTDSVDSEIDQLKTREQRLKLQLETASDTQKDAIQRQLTQIENELLWKDTDTYRQQHAVVS